MITKLYKFLIKNIKFFILLMLFLICFIDLPYYIDAPGGLLNVNDKISIQDKNNLSGSISLAYVSEYKGSIPMLIYSLFNKNFDIQKETKGDNSDYRNEILLTESTSNALLVALDRANIEYEIENKRVVVTYVSSDSDTTLEVGDIIYKVNNEAVNSKEELLNIIKEYDTFNIEVVNNNKRYIRTATKNNNIIGITVSELFDINSSVDIKFNFSKHEMGPSGGAMMSLAIYNYLSEDITNGKKIEGTGTIDSSGNIGVIGGIKYKILAASKENVDVFFLPRDNYLEAYDTVVNNNLNINLVSVDNIDDVINYLSNN